MSKDDGAVATLQELRARRDEILRIAPVHDTSNVRVYGSVARAVDPFVEDRRLGEIFPAETGFRISSLDEYLEEE